MTAKAYLSHRRIKRESPYVILEIKQNWPTVAEKLLYLDGGDYNCYLRCRSVIIDNVKTCPAIVLGPTQGPVILREVHCTNISVMCRQSYLWNCSDIIVFLHTFRPPVVRGCSSVQFSIFNASYEGIAEEIEAAGLQSARYDLISHVLNLDESRTSVLPVSKFYIQPVPMVNSKRDIKDLLDKLPPNYCQKWEKSLQLWESSKFHSDANLSLPLSKSDLNYLRSKIVKEESDGEDV
ncbi:hypothetical protein KIN20_023602 [Parelaphostrongylus tenuis]|uniref:Tubulin binding cofactor C-like domain-containing protein n=1 Tax=Parelaphostrongylus tenuis TaxID=148309 RepID=A0AAD5QW77_PARTN|nr:hypothetical protein KIN20_023602 [Parelaphostrongylus tenuis]